MTATQKKPAPPENPRLQLRRRLVEAKRWREVLHLARETVRNHSPHNCAPEIRAQRMEDAKQRIAAMDVVIASIEADIAALDQPPTTTEQESSK